MFLIVHEKFFDSKIVFYLFNGFKSFEFNLSSMNCYVDQIYLTNKARKMIFESSGKLKIYTQDYFQNVGEINLEQLDGN